MSARRRRHGGLLAEFKQAALEMIRAQGGIVGLTAHQKLSFSSSALFRAERNRTDPPQIGAAVVINPSIKIALT